MQTQNYKQDAVVAGNLQNAVLLFSCQHSVTALVLLQLRFFMLHETYFKPVSSVCAPT